MADKQIKTRSKTPSISELIEFVNNLDGESFDDLVVGIDMDKARHTIWKLIAMAKDGQIKRRCCNVKGKEEG